MKSNKQHFGFYFAMIIVAAFFMQAFHSYEHLHKLFAEKQCHHQYNNKAEIGHYHHELDHCFACEFTFSPNTTITNTTFSFFSPEFIVQKSVSFLAQNPNLFRDGLFLLRAPPIVIA